MKKFLLSFMCIVAAITTGCGQVVEVPPAHKGKIFTSGGYQKGIVSPSSLILPYERRTEPFLVVAEVSDQSKEEKMSIPMPLDNLILEFDVRGTFCVTSEASKLEDVFQRLAPSNNKEFVRRIDFDDIYTTYALPIIRTQSRNVITKYKIEYVLKNMEAVSNEMTTAIRQDLENTPVRCAMLGLSGMRPPKVIIEAQEAAAAREIAIQQAEADKLVSLKKAEAALEVAKKQQQVELIEAETQVLVDKKLAEGVSDAWLRQRGLAVLEKMCAGDNKIIFLPTEALQNPGIMMGVFGPNTKKENKP